MSLKDFKKARADAITKYKHGVVEADANILIHKIILDSPQLTRLFSGFSYDRIHQSFGPESSGKSTVYTYIAGQLQDKMPKEIERMAKYFEDVKHDKDKAKKFREDYEDKQVVAYLDYEGTFDPNFAQRLGLKIDDDHFVLIQADTLEEGFAMLEPMVKSGSLCCVIFDSDAAACSNLDLESDFGSTGFNGAKDAAALAMVYKKYNVLARNYLTPMLVVSQERDNMNIMAKLPSTTGGKAIRFYASTRNRITKLDTAKNKDGKDAGIKLRVRNYKNKTGTPWRDAELTLWFDSGIDSNLEYIDFIIEFELIEVKGGGNFAWEEKGMKCRGRDNLVNWLLAHPAEYDELKAKVNALLLDGNKLDLNNYNPEEDDIKEVAKNTNKSIEEIAEEALKAAQAETNYSEEEETKAAEKVLAENKLESEEVANTAETEDVPVIPL